ncbi:hypothetical protein RFI_25377 [Reticulomyxa filosa]|uniref:Uncharacterized protein n=1 Tax=Reticulomyxa filosa TaxID=46433 RepID=X6MG34_RETFI|nr:hypothetical protein RFI_25377 [Reticulomyxa filosa]|eukprot:ETO12000.1 hypothetical protein RFI_25377 [Reticulomyxa filosa]
MYKKLKERQDKRTYGEKARMIDSEKLKKEKRFLFRCFLAIISGLGAYLYTVTGTDMGKAHSRWKAGLIYEYEIHDFEKAKQCYLEAIAFTDNAFPKYLYDFGKFLWTRFDDRIGAEKYVRKAIEMHKSNSLYHSTLLQLIESYGDERKEEATKQRNETVKAHIYEANYFLSPMSTQSFWIDLKHVLSKYFLLENYVMSKDSLQRQSMLDRLNEKNWQSARMHLDYAISAARMYLIY